MSRSLAVLFAVLALPPAALAETAPEQTLSVLGRGVARVVPDVADLSIGVTAVRPTAIDARNSVNARTGRIIAATLSLDIPRTAVQTSETALQRQVRRQHGRRVVRYFASSRLAIHVAVLAVVSPVLEAATRLGASSFDGPFFGFSDPSAGRRIAERAALADARSRADAAAAESGLRVVGIRSIDLDPSSSGPTFAASAPASATAPSGSKARPTPVLPGVEEVTAEVAVVYVLGS